MLACLFTAGALRAQSPGGHVYLRWHMELESNGDTIPVIDLPPIPIGKRPDLRKYAKMIYNLRKVYPIAKQANKMLLEAERQMAELPNDKARKAYIKAFEDQVKTTYTPVLKNMTFSQGKLLIKLIDRETSRTSYDLVKELRGGFSAFFWQSIARIFGANLKDTYDKEGEDMVVEQLIMYYEAGML